DAGKRGLIHRDVKPANIVMTKDGIAKLADLGLAHESGAGLSEEEKGLAVGTPFYIAPEQIRADPDIDIRADVYSLGGTLYHMVTGQPPFPNRGISKMLASHLDEPLTPPDHLNQILSGGLAELVEFMMAKDREDRYRTPEDLIIDLECLLNGEPPKLARQRIEAASLQSLAEGEADEVRPRRRRQTGLDWVWVGVLAGVLGISVL